MDDKEEKKEIKVEADIKDHRVQPALTCVKGEHYFVQINGTEVQCRKCPVGYNIGPGTTIKDGHIYIHNTFLV